MKLIKRVSQVRRDFRGLYQCEGCGREVILSGCDDRYYHDEVEPALLCPDCGESTRSLGIVPDVILTRYAEGQVV